MSIAGTAFAAEPEVASPVNPVTTLSGSYAEMRRNHFHGGLDFRTGGQVNWPIYSLKDGYISHISISSRSYGEMAIIVHPDGHSTLYAHLNCFVDSIEAIVRKHQYEQQKYEVELDFAPGEIQLKKGQQFAWSGNTGSSGGPHLHFELRDTEKNTQINPFMYNHIFKFEDRRRPVIWGVKLNGIDGKGSVLGSKARKFSTTRRNNKKTLNNGHISVWGEIGIAIKSNDYMTGTGFTYSPRIMKLYIDSALVSQVHIKDIKIGDTRALNSFIDFAQQQTTGEFFMKFHKEKNNPLTIYDSIVGSGTFNFNEEREYKVKCEVFDDFGLKDEVCFSLFGEKRDLPPASAPSPDLIDCRKGGFFEKEDFLMYFPNNALYTDFEPNYTKRPAPSARYFSDIHTIGSKETPLHTMCDISIKIKNDTLKDKNKYVVATINPNGTVGRTIAANYVDGFMVGKTRLLGSYAIVTDNTKPHIGALHTKKLTANPRIVLKIYDGLSGIASYNGYIDGQWVLFEYDAKTQTVFCNLRELNIERNKQHEFKFVVKDKCGNETVFSRNIFY